MMEDDKGRSRGGEVKDEVCKQKQNKKFGLKTLSLIASSPSSKRACFFAASLTALLI
jgi:hypothetical protein